MDPNANLAELRELRAWWHEEMACPPGTTTHSDTLREQGARFAELIGALDEWLSRGGFLPTEWRPELPASDLDGHQLLEELRGWTFREPPLGVREAREVRALLDKLERWMAEPVSPLNTDTVRRDVALPLESYQRTGYAVGGQGHHAHRRGLGELGHYHQGGDVPHWHVDVDGPPFFPGHEVVELKDTPWPRRVTIISTAPVTITWED